MVEQSSNQEEVIRASGWRRTRSELTAGFNPCPSPRLPDDDRGAHSFDRCEAQVLWITRRPVTGASDIVTLRGSDLIGMQTVFGRHCSNRRMQVRVFAYTWAGGRTDDPNSSSRFFSDILGLRCVHDGKRGWCSLAVRGNCLRSSAPKVAITNSITVPSLATRSRMCALPSTKWNRRASRS
jgi:hypothetical protein